jgi:iron(III) transport system permease protein
LLHARNFNGRAGRISCIYLVFVLVLKGLPITFLLAPTGYTTRAISVFDRTSELLADAAPYALDIVLFSSVFMD